jgi:hypothetical protein
MSWLDIIGDKTQICINELPERKKYDLTDPIIRLQFDAELKHDVLNVLYQRGWHTPDGAGPLCLRYITKAEDIYLRCNGIISHSPRSWKSTFFRYHILTVVSDGIVVNTSLKEQNSKSNAINCAQCGRLLKIVAFGIKYCPVCEA